MSGFDKAVALLGHTDGRDKLFKALLGFFQIMADFSTRQNSSHAAGYTEVVACVTNVRSLLRMGKFVADFAKLRALLDLFRAQGLTYTENKKFVEFFRVLCNAVYVALDNLAFFCRYDILEARRVADVHRAVALSRRAQLLGYLLSLVVNLYELRDALLRLEYDPPAAKAATKRSIVGATRDTADALATAALLGVGRSVWNPSEATSGALICLSGLLSTYLNWNKIKYRLAA